MQRSLEKFSVVLTTTMQAHVGVQALHVGVEAQPQLGAALVAALLEARDTATATCGCMPLCLHTGS